MLQEAGTEGERSTEFIALRKTLLSTLALWHEAGHTEKSVWALERFTQHYYQDRELLQKYVELLISLGESIRAVEVCMSAEPLSRDASNAAFFKKTAYYLARELIRHHKKQHSLENLLPLFQKLSHLSPDDSFYRYSLAEIYLAANFLDDAITQLLALQDDQIYGTMATLLLADLSPPQVPDEPEEPAPGSIPLIASGSHFLAPMTIGEKATVSLLIDTGATLTTLSPSLLQALNGKKAVVRTGHTHLKTMNGPRFAPIYTVKTLKIGTFILENIEVAALEMSSSDGIDGLLGMNILGKFMFQIDQDQRTLILIPR